MKVSSASAAVSPGGPSCALKGVRLAAGDAPPPSGRCLSEQSAVSLSGGVGAGSPPFPPPPRGSLPPLCPAASLLMDMRGCYSRLAALVPTLPRHRRVSKVEILQHVIDYIWDLQLELQHPPMAGTPPGNPPTAAAARGAEEPAGTGTPEAACVNPDDRILCR